MPLRLTTLLLAFHLLTSHAIADPSREAFFEKRKPEFKGK